jgi:hypothetical protein
MAAPVQATPATTRRRDEKMNKEKTLTAKNTKSAENFLCRNIAGLELAAEGFFTRVFAFFVLFAVKVF